MHAALPALLLAVAIAGPQEDAAKARHEKLVAGWKAAKEKRVAELQKTVKREDALLGAAQRSKANPRWDDVPTWVRTFSDPAGVTLRFRIPSERSRIMEGIAASKEKAEAELKELEGMPYLVPLLNWVNGKEGDVGRLYPLKVLLIIDDNHFVAHDRGAYFVVVELPTKLVGFGQTFDSKEPFVLGKERSYKDARGKTRFAREVSPYKAPR